MTPCIEVHDRRFEEILEGGKEKSVEHDMTVFAHKPKLLRLLTLGKTVKDYGKV